MTPRPTPAILGLPPHVRPFALWLLEHSNPGDMTAAAMQPNADADDCAQWGLEPRDWYAAHHAAVEDWSLSRTPVVDYMTPARAEIEERGLTDERDRRRIIAKHRRTAEVGAGVFLGEIPWKARALPMVDQRPATRDETPTHYAAVVDARIYAQGRHKDPASAERAANELAPLLVARTDGRRS